jgi:hypothetical protein
MLVRTNIVLHSESSEGQNLRRTLSTNSNSTNLTKCFVKVADGKAVERG